MADTLIVHARTRRAPAALYILSALCLAASVVLFALHFYGTPSSENPAEKTVGIPVRAPEKEIARAGDPGSAFDAARYDTAFPKMQEWARAGVKGGIPLRRDTPASVQLSPGDDIQAAIDSVSKSGGVVLLGAGTYKLTARVELKSNVVLRGESVDTTIIEMPLAVKKEDVFGAVRLNNTSRAGLEDFTLRFPAEWNLQEVKINLNTGISVWKCTDCWVDNIRINYCDSFALSVQHSKQITLRDILVRGPVNRTGTAFLFDIKINEKVLGVNLTLFDLQYFGLGWNKSCVFLNCYLHKDVRIECKQEELDEVLLEGFNMHHSTAPKYRRPETKFGTYYPVTGVAKTADELYELYGKSYAERAPGDF